MINNNNSSSSSSPSLRSPEEIFDQLTLNEKISLLSGKSMWTLHNIKRLNLLPTSVQVSDGPQGVRKAITDLTAIEAYPATCFPTACAMACSWNATLINNVGKALAKECRQQNVNILLGPGFNIKRHPCGGRNFEYFSEDPFVSGKLASAMVSGIQGSGHVGACIKHVCVNNQESWRFRVNVIIDERSLREIYLQAFEYVIKQSQPWTLMCAYNQLNGIYCSENEWLFQEVIRKEWGYEGHVLTDWGATNRRIVGIEAGIDLEMPGSYDIHKKLIKNALKDGSLSQDRFDEAVLRNIRLIHKASTAEETGNNTGEYELPPNPEDLYEQHHELAYQAALECCVLLQNGDNMLPLPPKQSNSPSSTASPSIALIGDFCRDPRYQGMGSSKVNATKVDTMLEHISKYTDNFVFSPGYCNSDDDDDDGKSRTQRNKDDNHRTKLLQEAVESARGADIVIIMAGVPEIHESEGFDREHLDLPVQHNSLIEQVCQVNSNVVVVLCNGGPVLMPWKDKVKSILECYLLGQAGARAILDILFGVSTPCGKLTETFPMSTTDVPSDKYFPGNSHTVEYREGLNVGYRYYDTAKVPVLFPFGHGLSYTQFSYTGCVVSVMSNDDIDTFIRVKCTITNQGTKLGSEIVQIYVHHDKASSTVYHPEQQLKDFKKTQLLEPGQTEDLEFDLPAQAFSFFDTGLGEWILEENAKYEIRVAASSRDIRFTNTINCSEVFAAGGCKAKVTKPSSSALSSHPPLQQSENNILSHPLNVNNESFRCMLGKDPSVLMHLSSRSLLGQAMNVAIPSSAVGSAFMPRQDLDLMSSLLPSDIEMIHRNSFLSEIEQNGCFGKLFTKIIIKAMEQEMEDPSDKRQCKMIREVAKNLPLRCLATFSRGNMSFSMLDSLIAFFNGQYRGAISHIFAGARSTTSSAFRSR